MTDAELRRHPLFERLVPVLAAAPHGQEFTVLVRFAGGQPQHILPTWSLGDTLLPPVFTLPWPTPVGEREREVCRRVAAYLESIWRERHAGDLVLTVPPSGPIRVAWQPRIAVRPLVWARE